MTNSYVNNIDDLERITWSSAGQQLEIDSYAEPVDTYSVAIMENEQFDERRWVSVHRVVWCENHEGENHYFACYYEQPLTELQEGSESELDCADIWEVSQKVEIKEVVSYV